jgi:hypothetical protein
MVDEKINKKLKKNTVSPAKIFDEKTKNMKSNGVSSSSSSSSSAAINASSSALSSSGFFSFQSMKRLLAAEPLPKPNDYYRYIIDLVTGKEVEMDLRTGKKKVHPVTGQPAVDQDVVIAYAKMNEYGIYDIPVNHTQAAKLYSRIALLGNARAQAKLGYCYEVGRGVVKDIKQAANLYQLAAAQGHRNAAHRLKMITKRQEVSDPHNSKGDKEDNKLKAVSLRFLPPPRIPASSINSSSPSSSTVSSSSSMTNSDSSGSGSNNKKTGKSSLVW